MRYIPHSVDLLSVVYTVWHIGMPSSGMRDYGRRSARVSRDVADMADRMRRDVYSQRQTCGCKLYLRLLLWVGILENAFLMCYHMQTPWMPWSVKGILSGGEGVCEICAYQFAESQDALACSKCANQHKHLLEKRGCDYLDLPTICGYNAPKVTDHANVDESEGAKERPGATEVRWARHANDTVRIPGTLGHALSDMH